MPDTYQWAHPLEWLHQHINECEDLNELRNLARQLASELDGDQIQDVFQSDMSNDGYFTPLRKARRKADQ